VASRDRGDLRIELRDRPANRAAVADDVHIRWHRSAVERQDAPTEVFFKGGTYRGFAECLGVIGPAQPPRRQG
jgi:hypothetical protein